MQVEMVMEEGALRLVSEELETPPLDGSEECVMSHV